jgi:hypothetical protein
VIKWQANVRFPGLSNIAKFSEHRLIVAFVLFHSDVRLVLSNTFVGAVSDVPLSLREPRLRP